MSSSNPFGFVGGMFLEIGAVVAVLAMLWQPSAGDTRPTLEPDFFAQQQPVRFTAMPVAQPAFPQQPPAYQQQAWRESERLLPAAPPMWDRGSLNSSLELRSEMQPQTRALVAQPYVRPLSERPVLISQPREYHAPSYRAADSRHGDYHNRY